MPIDLGAIFANIMGAQNAAKHPMDSYLDPTFNNNIDVDEMGNYIDKRTGEIVSDNNALSTQDRKPYTTPGMWAHLVNPATSRAIDQANFTYGNTPIMDAQAEELAKNVQSQRSKNVFGAQDPQSLLSSMAMFTGGRNTVQGGAGNPNTLNTEGLDLQGGRPALNSAFNIANSTVDAGRAANAVSNLPTTLQADTDTTNVGAIKARGALGRIGNTEAILDNTAKSGRMASGYGASQNTVPLGKGTGLVQVLDDNGQPVGVAADDTLNPMERMTINAMGGASKSMIDMVKVRNPKTGETSYVRIDKTPKTEAKSERKALGATLIQDAMDELKNHGVTEKYLALGQQIKDEQDRKDAETSASNAAYRKRMAPALIFGPQTSRY